MSKYNYEGGRNETERDSDKKGRENKKNSEHAGQEKQERSVGREVLSYVVMIAVVVVVVLFVNNVFLINARIPSASMEDTIMTNDRIFGNRLAYAGDRTPERYDIVIFRFPDNESELFIKRIIGLPGDTLTFRDGYVYLNDETEPLDDSFCLEQGSTDQGLLESPVITVPEGCYFMMGDNRNDSSDSRYWNNPFVTEDKILGKAVFRYWPLTRIGTVE